MKKFLLLCLTTLMLTAPSMADSFRATVHGTGGTVTHEYDNGYIIKATPDKNWVVNKWYVDGIQLATKRPIIKLSNAESVIVDFVPNLLRLSVLGQGSYKITGDIKPGETINLRSDDPNFLYWIVDGKIIESMSFGIKLSSLGRDVEIRFLDVDKK